MSVFASWSPLKERGMTSNDRNTLPIAIECEGVGCKSDLCLYDNRTYTTQVHLLSIYGAPQQTKALFSLLASSRTLCADETFLERAPEPIRFKGTKIGFAKHHGFIWSEKVGNEIIVWTSEGQRLNQLRLAISKRRIPLEPEKLPQIERVLLDNNYLSRLSGWGNIGGYITSFNDDEICNLILTEIYSSHAVSKKVA